MKEKDTQYIESDYDEIKLHPARKLEINTNLSP